MKRRIGSNYVDHLRPLNRSVDHFALKFKGDLQASFVRN